MIKVKNIHKSFDGSLVLNGIDARFELGKTNLIIGQSGSGKTVLLKLKLDERPKKIGRMKTSPEPTQTTEQFELLGMTVEELTEENAKQLGIEPGIGVVISNVKSGSPAEKSGLLPGMIVLEAERQAIRNIDTFKEIINDIDQGKGILLLIRTSNGSSYLFLKEN